MALENNGLFIPESQLMPPAHAAAHLGGKGAGMLRLRALGAPVPAFVVLPTALFEPGLAGLPTTAAGLAERRARLGSFEVPTATQAALRAVLAGWGFGAGQPVAVRSSVADEDGGAAAFPGLMDSVLHVADWPALLAAVARVAASAYSERALAYRRQRGLPLAARPAVVVQRQVAARAAGVLFTTFPEYPQEMAIHAVAGLAEGLVNGQLVPEEYYLGKADGQLVAQVASEVVEVAALDLLPAKSAPYAVASPAAVATATLLSTITLAELYHLGQRLEAALGGPQDIEFAQDEAGRLWLVQARPLTQPVPEVVAYDNANIQESYCGVTTPLTFSFAQRAYATVYRQTMRTLGLPAAVVAAHEPVITNLLALQQGRIYYNLNNWYRGLLLLPNFRQSKADMERMMGVLEPVDFVRDQRKTLAQRLALLPRLALTLGRLLGEFARLPGQVRAFQARCEAEYQRFYQLPLATLGAAELLREIEHLNEALLTRWTTPIINDFRVMMAHGAATRHLTHLGVADPDEFLSRYLAGSPAGPGAAAEPLASLLPALALRELGELARQEFPALLPLLENPGPELPAQVARLAPAFHERVRHYVAHYGDRTMGELKLETETMRTSEALFYRYLVAYLAPPAAPATAPASLPAQAAAELTARLSGRGWWRARQVRGSLAALRQAVARREALRLERTRLFGMYRAAYRALGQRLAAAGTLGAPLDVFLLTEAELASAARAGGPQWAALAAQRQAELAAYRAALAPAGRLVVPARPVAAPEAAAPADGRLRGTGCYPGQVSGEVVVITDPAQADLGAVRGRIVAALRTDPGWAALFPGCRAVLIERGSALSHSVILLRELGIPTIINVPGLTQHLRSGQRVRLDGRTGEVEVTAE
ncbi:PEP/pyruvate-binding domain-containing protein [Hymenobacter bucti]|uniref:PEP/pyruvate-binding domain-containing protein n=1 Tax=Hymenobacter bucti TaxID=1844114 RepID=A0ABW4QZJ5_9BACT